MDQWVKDNSINGPSPVEFTGLKKNELQLFYNIDSDAWLVVENLNTLDYTLNKFGIYYIVFKDEYINYLKTI